MNGATQRKPDSSNEAGKKKTSFNNLPEQKINE
jgi:hypothetical protein